MKAQNAVKPPVFLCSRCGEPCEIDGDGLERRHTTPCGSVCELVAGEDDGRPCGGNCGDCQACVDEAYAGLESHYADQRAGLREALALLLAGGPDAVIAAEDKLRSRLSYDGAYSLSGIVGELYPDHEGIYWAEESEGIDA